MLLTWYSTLVCLCVTENVRWTTGADTRRYVTWWSTASNPHNERHCLIISSPIIVTGLFSSVLVSAEWLLQRLLVDSSAESSQHVSLVSAHHHAVPVMCYVGSVLFSFMLRCSFSCIVFVSSAENVFFHSVILFPVNILSIFIITVQLVCVKVCDPGAAPP